MLTSKSSEGFLKKTGYRVLSLRHRSSPRPMGQCLELFFKLFPEKWEWAETTYGLNDPRLLKGFEPLTKLGDSWERGGAIWLVASKESNLKRP